MKKRISILLVVAMLVSSLLTFTVATAEERTPSVLFFGGSGFNKDNAAYNGVFADWEEGKLASGTKLESGTYFVANVAIKDYSNVNSFSMLLDYPEDVLYPVSLSGENWVADTTSGILITGADPAWEGNAIVKNGLIYAALAWPTALEASSDYVTLFQLVFKYNAEKSIADIDEDSFNFVSANQTFVDFGLEDYGSAIITETDDSYFSNTGKGKNGATADTLTVVKDFIYVPVEDPTEAPVDPTEAPVDPTEAPEDPTEAPVDPTEAPEDPTEAPVDPTEAPEDPTEAPVDPTEAPESTSSDTRLAGSGNLFTSGISSYKRSGNAFTANVIDGFGRFVVGARKAHGKATVYSAIVPDLDEATIHNDEIYENKWYQYVEAANLKNGEVAYIAFKVVAEDGTKAYYTLKLSNPVDDMSSLWVGGLLFDGLTKGDYTYDIMPLSGYSKYVVAARMSNSKMYEGLNIEYRLGVDGASYEDAVKFGNYPLSTATYAAAVEANRVNIGDVIYVSLSAGEAEPKVYSFTVVNSLY